MTEYPQHIFFSRSIFLLMVLPTVLICHSAKICGMLVPTHNCPMEAEQRTLGYLDSKMTCQLDPHSQVGNETTLGKLSIQCLSNCGLLRTENVALPSRNMYALRSFRTQFFHSVTFIKPIFFKKINGHNIPSPRRSNPGRWQGASFISINVYLLLLDMTDFVFVFQSQILYKNVQLIAISSI